MRALGVSAILILFAPISALGLLSPRPVVDPRTPEGQFFQLLDLEDDSAKRLALIQQFAIMFPTHPATMWGWEQIQEAQRQAGQHEKVIETAEKLLSMNPDHIDGAYYAWKAVGAKGDTALMAKWLERLNEMSARIVASARPSKPADAAGWESSVSLAKQFIASNDVGLYAKALEARDPAKRIAILDEMVKASPDSAKAVDTSLLYFLAYRDLGNGPKAVEAGLRVIAVSKNHEDILLFLADYYFQRRESEKSTTYAQRLIEVMRTKVKPAGLRDSDWARQKAVCNGSAYYMIGFLQMEAGQYANSDAHFRAALGYIGDDQLKAIVLNSLGYVNLRMEKHAEALGFYKRCMEIKGPYQLQSAQNVDTLLLQHPEIANR